MRIVETVRKLFAKDLSPVPTGGRGSWFPLIHEPYAGAWQRGETLTQGTFTTYSTVYACLSRISKDIGKLPFRLVELDRDGLWRETTNPAYSPLLRKPNHYQTAAQFREAWVLSKLQHGNTYALKRRDNRGVVDALYILDPTKVTPLVGDNGGVFYEVRGDNLNHVSNEGRVVIPSREMIHDRETCLHHPLIGVPPLAAACLPATKNIRIQQNEAAFFENGARLSGILTLPAGISDEDAEKMSTFWNKNFSGQNTGRVAAIGADAKYVPVADNAANSQLVEQLRYSDEQIAHAFGIPPFKVGIGQLPAGQKVDDINQVYYSDALQARIESMEDCLDQGLGLGDRIGVELNLEPLLRMDAQKLAEVEGALVKNGIKAPNEARKRFGLAPLTGGDSVYLQQQNFSLEALARRDASADPFGTGKSDPAATKQIETVPKDIEPTEKPRAKYSHETKRWEKDPHDWRWNNPQAQLAWQGYLHRLKYQEQRAQELAAA